MKRLPIFLALSLAACGGSLKYSIDDNTIASTTTEERAPINAARDEQNRAQDELRTAENGLKTAENDLDLAENEYKTAKLAKDSAKLNRQAAEQSGDMNRKNKAEREYTAAELDALLRRVFTSVEMLGVHGSDRLLEFEQRRRQTVQAILRLDVLGLRRRLPRAVLNVAFARLAVVVRVLLGGGRAASHFGVDDFPVHGERVDDSLDLLAVCRT